MITVTVCGWRETWVFARAGITDIISIGDPGMPLPDLRDFLEVPRLYRFEFTDICHVAPPGDKDVSVTMDDIKKMIYLFRVFLASKEDLNVLFHCTAARSRSPAAAFIFLVVAGKSYEEAYTYLRSIGRPIEPNILMIKYADIALNQGGKMLDYVASHYPNAQEWVKLNGYTL